MAEPARTTKSQALVITDLTKPRNEYFFKPPGPLNQWLLSLLRDERDAPLAYQSFNICVLVVPAALVQFFLPPSHLLGCLYMGISLSTFLQRFCLGLHYQEHNPIFKPGPLGWFLNQLYPNLLCVLYGIPPGFYRLHHIVMHHCENNQFPYDISSTEPFQRDNFVHWILYWIRFWAAIWIELPYYALHKRRWSLLFTSFPTLVAHALATSYLYLRWPTQTTYVLIIPFIFATVALMFGNWSQHIFIDPSRHTSNYGLTMNLINADDNLKTCNDGYHIVHHANSKVHWTDLPRRFLETLDKHAEEDALIFEGIGFFDVGLMAMTGQLDKLADRYVNIGQKQRTKEELIVLFKERLRPIGRQTTTGGVSSSLDSMPSFLRPVARAVSDVLNGIAVTIGKLVYMFLAPGQVLRHLKSKQP